MSTILEAALHYRSLGFAVLPLAGKTPHTGLLRRTHGTRSTNKLVEFGAGVEQMRVWFSDPGINIGVFCGAVSGGLVVVDLDDCEFPPAGAMLPLTPLVKTGRDQHRGFHLYYRSTAETRTRPFPWGEIRGMSPSYVVAPPSVHPETGHQYAWQLPLHEAPLADFSMVSLPSSVLRPSPGGRRTEYVLLRMSYWGHPVLLRTGARTGGSGRSTQT